MKSDRNIRYEAKRRDTAPWRSWYSTKAWKLLRREQLAKHPNCRRCGLKGRIKRANTVNHVEPHRGDRKKFFGGELESVCAPCHDGLIQAEEVNGFSRTPGKDGWPDDPRHPFNRRGAEE